MPKKICLQMASATEAKYKTTYRIMHIHNVDKLES